MPGAVRGYLGLQAQLGKHAAPVVVGNALVDPTTGKPIYQGPDKATKPQVFGSEATGYYSLGEDGKPQPLIPGHEPGMTPYQQAQSRRSSGSPWNGSGSAWNRPGWRPGPTSRRPRSRSATAACSSASPPPSRPRGGARSRPTTSPPTTAATARRPRRGRRSTPTGW
jgi:hypothetical protein